MDIDAIMKITTQFHSKPRQQHLDQIHGQQLRLNKQLFPVKLATMSTVAKTFQAKQK